MTFPPDIQLAALLRGLNHKEGDVRAACAFMLLYWQDTQVLQEMRQHVNDPDKRVSSFM